MLYGEACHPDGGSERVERGVEFLEEGSEDVMVFFVVWGVRVGGLSCSKKL